MKAVFLDFDGVLNSHRSAIAYGGVSWSGEAGIRGKMDDIAVRLIGGIVRQAGAVVVLSTSWRNDSMWTTYGKALDLPVVDRTPSLPGSRGTEIAAWLARHPGVERYAIIDDDADMLPEQQPYFIHTSMFDGFSWANALRLADLMGINIFDVNHPGQRLPVPTFGLSWDEATATVQG